jgi:DNA-binding response OmpR family regulator
MPPAPGPREEEARLTGARADFAGSLPRRLETLRGALAAAEQLPADPDRVKGLLRRVHAVGSAARVLGFASVAEALAEAERSVRRATAAGKPAPFEEVSRAFDVLPSLVLGAPVSTRSPESRARAATPAWPTSVLLLGSAALAAAITEPDGGPSVECERLDDAARLVELAHIVGPDVVVVDGDHAGAREAVAKLASDDLLEPTPVIVIGSFEQPESAAPFIELGVARVLPKPCSPDTLRRTIDELREHASQPRTAREPLGELSMNALTERIAGEFKRGLVDALEAGVPNAHVALGDGHDVLAAVWGAVARVRELVTLRSSGSMRFQPTGPEGGVPFAPWAGGERRAGERGPGRSRDAGGVSLQGRRIIVADDDPAVVWFMAGLLRAVGVEVLEAHDGRRALELAFEHWPDAIVSDVLMPKLDGYSLCHEVKRDVAVRDVPVILLSWKEDLLQRVRELGAAADGYLRKEAAASAVVERVREILRTRARVEERMAAGGEVRGRLDGLTPRLVLELACRGERDVRVSVRDAAFLFEVQIRKGRLVSLSRSAADGSFVRGNAVIPSLLGASAGRFSVEADASNCRTELTGTLFDLLKEPVARARQALRDVSADALLRLERVELDRPLLETYLGCTPEPAAFVTRRLLEGQSPRDLVMSGAVSARLLEVVLSDIARRGGVLAVSAVPAAQTSSAPPPEPVLSLEPPAAALTPSALPRAATTFDADDVGWFGMHDSEPPPISAQNTAETPAVRTVSAPPVGAAREPAQSPLVPAQALRVEGIVETLALNAEPTPNAEAEPMLRFGGDTSTLDGLGEVATGTRDQAARAAPDPDPQELGEAALGLLGEAVAEADGKMDSLPPASPRLLAPAPASPPASLEPTPSPDVIRGLLTEQDATRRVTEPPQRGRSAPSVAQVTPAEPKKASGTTLVVRSIGAGAFAFALMTWVVLPLFPGKDEKTAVSETAEEVAAPAPSAVAAPAAALTLSELEPPRGMELAPDQGIIEIETNGPDPIYVDGAFVGLGPMRRISAPAGAHRVEVRGDRATGPLELSLGAGRRARVVATATPTPVGPASAGSAR